MPKLYTLKREIATPEKINRILKTVLDQNKQDRQEAESLLNQCKDRLTSAEDNEEFTKLIGATTTVLNQMQNCSTKLIKVIEVFNKFSNDKGEGKTKSKEFTNFFDELTKLTETSDGKENTDS
jgi:flagellar biosynthesis/type III secretory pathway chaperone